MPADYGKRKEVNALLIVEQVRPEALPLASNNAPLRRRAPKRGWLYKIRISRRAFGRRFGYLDQDRIHRCRLRWRFWSKCRRRIFRGSVLAGTERHDCQGGAQQQSW